MFGKSVVDAAKKDPELQAVLNGLYEQLQVFTGAMRTISGGINGNSGLVDIAGTVNHVGDYVSESLDLVAREINAHTHAMENVALALDNIAKAIKDKR